MPISVLIPSRGCLVSMKPGQRHPGLLEVCQCCRLPKEQQLQISPRGLRGRPRTEQLDSASHALLKKRHYPRPPG